MKYIYIPTALAAHFVISNWLGFSAESMYFGACVVASLCGFQIAVGVIK